MEINGFKTDLEKISFLIEADADLRLGLLAAEGKLELVTDRRAAGGEFGDTLSPCLTEYEYDLESLAAAD
ncbi:MAG TPA: hypothetical protein PK745_03090, partial [bacterium]|nr:hypothetical protein [bacterium]